jgi:hypothetical protein
MLGDGVFHQQILEQQVGEVGGNSLFRSYSGIIRVILPRHFGNAHDKLVD